MTNEREALATLVRQWRGTAKGYLSDDGIAFDRAMGAADAYQGCADALESLLTSPPAPSGSLIEEWRRRADGLFAKAREYPEGDRERRRYNTIAGVMQACAAELEVAPSGWQQRIRALKVYWTNDTGLVPMPMHARMRSPNFGWLLWKEVRAILDDAKDAIPPSSGWSVEDERKAVIAYILSSREERDVVQVYDVMASHIRDGRHLPDALPPAPEGSPAKETRDVE